MNGPSVLFAFTHLLGVGHVHRAHLLGHAMAREGLRVHGVHGGVPLPHLAWPGAALHHLPPVRARDATYGETLTGEGNPLDGAYLERRRDALLSIARKVRPDCVLVEAWPFGRRFMAGEMAALRAALPEVPFVVSVRDILQARRPDRMEESIAHVERLDAQVLVHADPAIVRLEDSFPPARRIAERVTHTGFVVPPDAGSARDVPPCDVLVSAGGGAFGGELMAVACAAARAHGGRWRIVTGQNLPRAERAALAVPSNAVLETRVDGLAAHMAGAGASISQCGYNTAMDTLRAAAHGTRTVFVPHDTTGQTEQLARAERFADAGRAVCLPQSRLGVDALLDALARAPDPSGLPLPDMDGAVRTARLVRRIAS